MALGYRMVSFDFDTLQIVTKQFGHQVEVNANTQHFPQGLYLGSDTGFLDYYRDSPQPDERRQDVKLTYEYDPNDLIQGDGSPDQELIVKSAKLVGVEFDDVDMQASWGFLLDAKKADHRREVMQGSEVQLGGQLGYVVRAQDAKMDYLLDADFCYRHSGLGTNSATCQRVLDDLEEGNEPRNVHEKLLKMALVHGITMAITSGLPKQVMFYPVKQGQLFEADNAGEYFYRGSPTNKGKVLFEIDENGMASLPSPKKDLGLKKESELSYGR